MTLGVAFHLCLTGMGDFAYCRMALLAGEFPVGRLSVFCFINMKNSLLRIFIQPDKAGILMTGQAAVLVTGERKSMDIEQPKEKKQCNQKAFNLAQN